MFTRSDRLVRRPRRPHRGASPVALPFANWTKPAPAPAHSQRECSACHTRFRRCTDLHSCCHDVYTRNTLAPCTSCFRTSAVRFPTDGSLLRLHRLPPLASRRLALRCISARFRPRAGRSARTRARAAWCGRRRAHPNSQRGNAPGALHEFGHAKPPACNTGGCGRCELLQRAWHRQVCDSADLCRCAFEQHASVSEPIV